MCLKFSKVILFISYLLVLCYCDLQWNEDSILYFAYGSNLLARRIHINNPTAVFYDIARLEGYRLDFNLTTQTWHGAVATIVEDPASNVWGALWTIKKSEIDILDRQEGVDAGWYYAKNVSVVTPQGMQYIARTYQEFYNPPNLKPEELPLERRPSITYLQVIIIGAYECGIPSSYFGYLWKFPTNGNFADSNLTIQLGYPFDVSS